MPAQSRLLLIRLAADFDLVQPVQAIRRLDRVNDR